MLPTLRPTQRVYPIVTTTPYYDDNYESCLSWKELVNIDISSNKEPHISCIIGIVKEITPNAGDCEYIFNNYPTWFYTLDTKCSRSTNKIEVGDCVVLDGSLTITHSWTRAKDYNIANFHVAHWRLDSSCSQ
jgi:hypothetical protein